MSKNMIMGFLVSVFVFGIHVFAGEMPSSVEYGQRKLLIKSSVYDELPAVGKGIRLGVYQAQAAYGKGATAKNIKRLEKVVRKAAGLGVQLVSFPELYLTGYTLSPDMAKEVAEFETGASITKARKLAAELKIGILLPYAEKALIDGKLLYFDSIAVINEEGKLVTCYRKTHLYAQAERDNWSFGMKEPPVAEFFGFPVGVLNCYECEFPELSRVLALKGAKLIVGPTAADMYYTMANGKRSPVPYPDVSTIIFPANAYANNIFFAYSNRAGYEKQGKNSWHYRGHSIIIGPHGDIIVKASQDQDTLLIADCIPGYYGPTHPEEPEYNYLKDRRPDMYKGLIAPEAEFDGRAWEYPEFKGHQELNREK